MPKETEGEGSSTSGGKRRSKEAWAFAVCAPNGKNLRFSLMILALAAMFLIPGMFAALSLSGHSPRVGAHILANTDPMILAAPNNGNPIITTSGAPVELTAVLYDMDGDTLNVTWDWGDETAPGVNSTEPAGAGVVVLANHTWDLASIPGLDETISIVYYLIMTVDDGMGGTVSSNVTVNVYPLPNAPPEFSISIPQSIADPQDEVLIVANASDREGEALNWTFQIFNGTELVDRVVSHTGVTAPNATVWNNVTHVFGAEGSYTVKLNITDSIHPYDIFPHNLSKSAFITIQINRVPSIQNVVNVEPEPIVKSAIGYIVSNFTVDVSDLDGDSLTVVWDFGNGFVFTNVTDSTPGTLIQRTVVQQMNFTDEGVWNLTINVTDGRPGHLVWVNQTINVTSDNRPPNIIDFGKNWSGQSLNRTYPIKNEAIDFYFVFTDTEMNAIQVTVDFGDNTTQYFNLTDYVDGKITLKFNHSYSADGNYSVIVKFTDNRIGNPEIKHVKYQNLSVRVQSPAVVIPNPWSWWDYTSLGLFSMVPILLVAWAVAGARKKKKLEEEGYSVEEWRLRKEVGDIEGSIEDKMFGDQKSAGGKQEEL